MNRFVGIGVTLAFAGAIVGCGGSGIIGQQLPRIRIFNAVDGANIAVTYRDTGGADLGTSQVAPFAGVSPKDLIIKNTNATPTVYSGSRALYSGSTNLYRINTIYTLYSGGTAGNYASVILNDNQVAGLTGNMEIRAVHMGANTAGVDVFVVPSGSTGVSGASLFNSLQFGGVSTSANSTGTVDNNGYSPTPATPNETFNVIVTAHNSTVPIATTSAVLNPTVYYTVVIYDSGTGTGVKIQSDWH
jgi:hypothetical protein